MKSQIPETCGSKAWALETVFTLCLPLGRWTREKAVALSALPVPFPHRQHSQAVSAIPLPSALGPLAVNLQVSLGYSFLF